MNAPIPNIEVYTDTGLLALAKIASIFDIAIEARHLQHQLGLGQQTATELDIRQGAKIIGLHSKVITTTVAALVNTPLPALTKIAGQYHILTTVNAEQVRVVSSVTGKAQWLTHSDFSDDWSKRVILLAEQALTKSDVNFSLNWFIPSLKQHSALVRKIVFISLFIQLMALVSPLMFQQVIDKVLVSRSYSSLEVLGVAMLGLAIYEPLFSLMRSWLFANFSGKLSATFSSKLYQHLTSLPLPYFSRQQTGQIIARVREMDAIRQFVSGSALTLILDLAFVGLFISVLFYYAPSLTWLVLGSLVVYFLFWRLIGPSLRSRVDSSFEKSADNTAFLTESISGIETIKTNAVEPIFIRQWQKNLAGQLKANFRAIVIGIWANQGIGLIQKITKALILWWGVTLVMAGKLTPGELVAFNMLSGQVTQPILRLAQIWQSFQHTLISLKRVGEILDEPIEAGSQGLSSTPAMQGAIEFEQVRFRYHSDAPEVLKNFNLTIQPGEFIGITGPSGCGKSTLTKLLQRLYSPTSGRVLVDGLDLAITDPVELRRNMSVVLQESMLFSGTITENICQCLPEADEQTMLQAAKLAGVAAFIDDMPQGYQTQVGERGSRLSGGQRQRVALARALITNPKILILDEATSALDYESEAAIMANMAEIIKNRTVISIAHRLNTLKLCDRVITLAP